MSFGITASGPFPPVAPDEFPRGLQWRLDGTDVGTREVDTVNFVSGETLSMVVDPEDPKILTITIPAGGGGEGGAVPNLVLSLEGASLLSFDNTQFSNWTAFTLVSSTDAEWVDGSIRFLAPGFYRVSIVGLLSVQGSFWATNDGNGSQVTKYGSAVDGSASPVSAMLRSVHERTAGNDTLQELSPNYVQWTDEFIVQVLNVGDITTPTVYGQHYNATEEVFANALVTVTKL